MAEYAQWRLQTNQPAVGTVLQQLLGNDDQMGALPAAFGPFTGVFNPLGPQLDHTVVIKCAPNTFTRLTAGANTVGWFDSEFPYMPNLMGAEHPCNPNVAATTYLTGYSRTPNAGNAPLGPSHVIALCGDVLGQAMFRRNTIGTDWSQRRWEGQSFDILAQYLTPTLLHEGMHVAGRSAEMYEWSNIVTSNRNDDKQANSDSYAILASGV
ncbi:hypothetical protein PRZ48_003814 [Zasmidium cellare]|uniref:Uncharacterized protein n=1 Tax=Zasmidium cellare TaxID=395010 RepID=A0ABR0EW46_ZASCE|nr:hypothetical protein PRZ48_003814 [Zasmidium cellare]